MRKIITFSLSEIYQAQKAQAYTLRHTYFGGWVCMCGVRDANITQQCIDVVHAVM